MMQRPISDMGAFAGVALTKWLSTFLASTIDPTHQVSSPHTNVYPYDLGWPWNDLPNCWRRSGINNWPHSPSFISKHQCLPMWPWLTPDDLEVIFKIFSIKNWPHPPSFMSIHQCWPHLTLNVPCWSWSNLQKFWCQQLTLQAVAAMAKGWNWEAAIARRVVNGHVAHGESNGSRM